MNNLVLLDGNKISGGINYITPECYSTEEREVGVWIDGKPIYEKTWTLNNLTLTRSAWTDTDIVLGLQQGDYALIESIVRDSNYSILATQVTPWSANGKVAIYNFRTADMVAVSITLRYVKASDTAGSGSWTPSGIPAVHYSEQEHIVGTWVDGKPIYEKTINFGALPNNTVKSVAHSISNIDLILNIFGFAKRTSDGAQMVIPYVHRNNKNSDVQLDANSTNINVGCADNRSAWDVCYITIQYTKSS